MARPPTPDISTVLSRGGEEIDEGSHPGALWLRRAMLAAMALVVAAALLSLLGVHTASVSADGDGYRLTVRYPAVARAGLDTSWQVTVTHPGGFGKEITLAVTGDYFTMFETQGFEPEPASETRDGRAVYLTFTAPAGETFVVDFDAYIQPSSQQGRAATVALMQHGAAVVSADLDTHLLP